MVLVRPEDWRPQGIDDLEDRAWTAIRETKRSVCVTAGAGAGKTELLAQKAAYLLQTGICPAPRRVLAISFKRDAAKTIANRVRLRLPAPVAGRFVSLTFDAWTKGLLDQFRRALPDPYVPTADYGIGFLGRDELDEFLALNGSDLNRIQLENLVARDAGPDRGRGLAGARGGAAGGFLAPSVRGAGADGVDLRNDQPVGPVRAAYEPGSPRRAAGDVPLRVSSTSSKTRPHLNTRSSSAPSTRRRPASPR
ncbi:MAG: UvrD-helicase domain-containing protein [Methylobacterium radiotolerans]